MGEADYTCNFYPAAHIYRLCHVCKPKLNKYDTEAKSFERGLPGFDVVDKNKGKECDSIT